MGTVRAFRNFSITHFAAKGKSAGRETDNLSGRIKRRMFQNKEME